MAICAMQYRGNNKDNVMDMLIDGGGMFKIDIGIVILCVMFNIFIVVMSGYIPSVVAGNKNIVDCIKYRWWCIKYVNR